MATKGNRPLDEVTEERERVAWELRQQGWSQARIAANLDISQQAVSKILNKFGRKLAAEFKNRAEIIKAEHTEMLERAADEAFQQWEASKQPVIKTAIKSGIQKVQSTSFADGKTKETGYEVIDLNDETTVTTEERNADPRYLTEFRGALSEIRKIWGAEAPVKTEVDTKHSGALSLNAPTLQKAAEEVSKWRQEQNEKLKQQREEREAELAAQSQEEE